MADESPVNEFIFGKEGDEPQIDLSTHGTGYLAVTLKRRHTTEWIATERKVAVVDGTSTLTIAAPAKGEIVTIVVEHVDDHA